MALLVAATTVVALISLARAPGEPRRLARLRADAALAATSLAKPTVAAFSAPCRRPLGEAVDQTQAQIRAAATSAGVELEALSATALAAPLPTDLVGARLDLKGRGEEGKLTQLIQALAAQRLPIFVDAATLTREPGGVAELKVNARLICRRAA